MESTLLTSTLGFCPTYYVPSQLTPFRVQTTCHHELRGLKRAGSGSQTLSFRAGGFRPVRKTMQSVFSSGDNSSSASEDVIVLNVGGMMCGGCADSVKRILESQPQVSSASVELTTETATVCPVSEAKVTANWQQQLGEALAKHLTTCGFASSVQG